MDGNGVCPVVPIDLPIQPPSGQFSNLSNRSAPFTVLLQSMFPSSGIESDAFGKNLAPLKEEMFYTPTSPDSSDFRFPVQEAANHSQLFLPSGQSSFSAKSSLYPIQICPFPNRIISKLRQTRLFYAYPRFQGQMAKSVMFDERRKRLFVRSLLLSGNLVMSFLHKKDLASTEGGLRVSFRRNLSATVRIHDDKFSVSLKSERNNRIEGIGRATDLFGRADTPTTEISTSEPKGKRVKPTRAK